MDWDVTSIAKEHGILCCWRILSRAMKNMCCVTIQVWIAADNSVIMIETRDTCARFGRGRVVMTLNFNRTTTHWITRPGQLTFQQTAHQSSFVCGVSFGRSAITGVSFEMETVTQIKSISNRIFMTPPSSTCSYINVGMAATQEAHVVFSKSSTFTFNATTSSTYFTSAVWFSLKTLIIVALLRSRQQLNLN